MAVYKTNNEPSVNYFTTVRMINRFKPLIWIFVKSDIDYIIWFTPLDASSFITKIRDSNSKLIVEN